jgi:alkylated DNA repair dioxygenase AlkB
MQSNQPSLFEVGQRLPLGFKYQAHLLSAHEEHLLVEQLTALPLRAFEFRGYLGKRRVISFGWQYDFNKGALRKADDIPSFLLPLRDGVARFAGMASSDLRQVLVTEYAPGAGIGWHRDKPMFDQVVGISLLSPCLVRFRRRLGTAWERVSLTAEPRSVYLLQGPSRMEWEHSIPAVGSLRYSVTFRSFKPHAFPT